MKAIWNNPLIANRSDSIVIDGNHYFPAASADQNCLVSGKARITCPGKGTARWHSIRVDDEVNTSAAWIYPGPEPAARRIKGRIAFLSRPGQGSNWRLYEISTCDINHARTSMPGDIDDVRVYNRALSQEEIRDLYLQKGWPRSCVAQSASGVPCPLQVIPPQF